MVLFFFVFKRRELLARVCISDCVVCRTVSVCQISLCREREPSVSATLFLPLDAKSMIYLTQLNKKSSVFPPSLTYLLKG